MQKMRTLAPLIRGVLLMDVTKNLVQITENLL